MEPNSNRATACSKSLTNESAGDAKYLRRIGRVEFGCLVLASLLNVGDIYGGYQKHGVGDGVNMKER
jgi:hypothetical protein